MFKQQENIFLISLDRPNRAKYISTSHIFYRLYRGDSDACFNEKESLLLKLFYVNITLIRVAFFLLDRPVLIN